MANSRFAYTRQKAGWDAQRHFEIMAGSSSYFYATATFEIFLFDLL